MKINIYNSLFGAILVSFLAISSCKKEYDSPPERVIPIGQILTIEELRNLHQGDGQDVRFNDGDYSVYAVVTADESSGNIYRNIFVDDGTGSIVLRLNNPGGVYQGDSIRIYLPGTKLSIFGGNTIEGGMMQIDSVDVDNNIIKQATQVDIEPEVVTIDQITYNMQGKLIKLENVEIVGGELCSTYADVENEQDKNVTLTDCNGNTIIMRNSSFANFADQTLPEGNGSFVAILDQFNETQQLKIRNINEVQLDGERCTPGDCEGGGGDCDYNVDPVTTQNLDFSDVTTDNQDYSNPLWLNIAHEGSRVWRGRTFQTDKYLRATAFGSNQTNSMWLISPPVQVMGPQLGLSFQSATAFWDNSSWEHPLTVYVSTDFDGCDIDGANWSEITGYVTTDSSSPNYTFVGSGLINVTDFLPVGFTGNVHIAFVYNGAHPAGPTTTLDLDNIVIQ